MCWKIPGHRFESSSELSLWNLFPGWSGLGLHVPCVTRLNNSNPPHLETNLDEYLLAWIPKTCMDTADLYDLYDPFSDDDD